MRWAFASAGCKTTMRAINSIIFRFINPSFDSNAQVAILNVTFTN